MLEKYKIVFTNKNEPAHGYEFEIKIRGNPKIQKSYPVPLALRGKGANKIESMIDAGIIERSTSPFCNPLRIVNKSDGDVRICLDARQLNTAIGDDHESPPIISEIIQEFHGAKIFSKLDFTNGYWQVPLHKDSHVYTAFLFDFTMYQFKRVPFGLKTAGSAFIRMFKNTISKGSKSLLKSLRYYIDDLIIANNSIEEHINTLEELFHILSEHNFTINYKKCKFFEEKIPFLGFILSSKSAPTSTNFRRM